MTEKKNGKWLVILLPKVLRCSTTKNFQLKPICQNKMLGLFASANQGHLKFVHITYHINISAKSVVSHSEYMYMRCL